MGSLGRRLELLEIRHKRTYIKPALVKLYKEGQTPTEKDIAESKEAQLSGRLVINFFAVNMGKDDDSIKRIKKRSKKK